MMVRLPTYTRIRTGIRSGTYKTASAVNRAGKQAGLKPQKRADLLNYWESVYSRKNKGYSNNPRLKTKATK